MALGLRQKQESEDVMERCIHFKQEIKRSVSKDLGRGRKPVETKESFVFGVTTKSLHAPKNNQIPLAVEAVLSAMGTSKNVL